MKNQITLTIFVLFAIVSANAQMSSAESEKPKFLKVECLNENSERNFMIWDRTEDGVHLDCENENGHLGYEANGLRFPMKLDELYDRFIVDVKKNHNSSDFLLRSLEMVETEKEISYSVHFYIPDTKEEGDFKTVFENTLK